MEKLTNLFILDKQDGRQTQTHRATRRGQLQSRRRTDRQSKHVPRCSNTQGREDRRRRNIRRRREVDFMEQFSIFRSCSINQRRGVGRFADATFRQPKCYTHGHKDRRKCSVTRQRVVDFTEQFSNFCSCSVNQGAMFAGVQMQHPGSLTFGPSRPLLTAPFGKCHHQRRA